MPKLFMSARLCLTAAAFAAFAGTAIAQTVPPVMPTTPATPSTPATPPAAPPPAVTPPAPQAPAAPSTPPVATAPALMPAPSPAASAPPLTVAPPQATAAPTPPPPSPPPAPPTAPPTATATPPATPTPAPAPTPPPRVGPLGAAKSWGYQLNKLDPKVLNTAPYDVLVIDYSRDGSEEKALTPAEVAALKVKPDGSRRIVLSYFSIGEAESYRYYWKWYWRSLWFLPNPFAPGWRAKLNGDWAGNYAVRYWDPAWQDILLGNGGYLDRILKAGFDGVWLDKVDSSIEEVAEGNKNAKKQMIELIDRIAQRGRKARPGFLIVPQNGEELLEEAGYRSLIDGIGKESILYGEDGPQKPNNEAYIAKRNSLLKPLVDERKTVLAVEYLDKPADITSARQRLEALGYIPHFAILELDSLRIGDLPPEGGTSSGKKRK